MEKHSEKSPILIAAAAARHVDIRAHCVLRAVPGFSPREAAVRGQAEAPGAGLLCVSPVETSSNPGVNQGVQGCLLPRPCVTMGWDWAHGAVTQWGSIKRVLKCSWGMNVCILQAAAAAAPGSSWRGTAGAASKRLVQVCLGIHSPVGMVAKTQLI